MDHYCHILALTMHQVQIPISSVFHSFVVKFLVSKQFGHVSRGPDCISIECFTYENTLVTVLHWSCFGTLIRGGRCIILSLSNSYSRTQQDQTWPNA